MTLTLQPGERVAKSGTFLYDHQVVCDLAIVYSPVRYGSGDYEDLVDIAEDRPLDTYYIWYGSAAARGEFKGGGGAFDTIEDAVRHAESAVGGVRWT